MRASPVFMLQMRQFARSRFLTTYVALLLFFMIACVALMLINVPWGSKRDACYLGREFFAYVKITIMFCCCLLLPFFVASKMNRDFLQLIALSTMNPWSVARGQLLSAGLLLAVGISLCLPVLAMAMMLRGIDAREIGSELVDVGLISIGLVQFFLLMAAFKLNPSWFGVLLICLLIGGSQGLMGAMLSMMEHADLWIYNTISFINFCGIIFLMQYLTVIFIAPGRMPFKDLTR